MPTVRLPTTPTSPTLKRNEHNNRRRTRRGESGTCTSPKTSKRVSSIHSSPPPVSDRESSLYSHRVYASPEHDWSKSCNDLGLASILARLDSPSPSTSTLALGLEFSPFSINTKPKAEAISIPHGSVYGNTPVTASRSVACLSTTSNADTASWAHTSSSPTSRRRSRRYQSVVDVDFAISESDDQVDLELERYIAVGNGTDSGYSTSTARNSSIVGFDERAFAYTYIPRHELSERRPEKKWFRSFWKVKDLVPKNKKSKNTMSGTPTIPPRSALRTVPPPKSTSPPPRPEVLERGSSLHPFRLGPALTQTPSLSSGSDGDVFDDATTHLPAGTAYRSPTTEEKERGFFGRKKLALERDPMKVRDGREPKESHSGVYTPPTFPGACGPRPSHFPSHVYTPQNFQLYPTPTPSIAESAGPSRSSSTSSTGESDIPQTPVSPTFRVFGNKAMAGLRRMSGQIASYSPTQSSSRDSYFSYSSTTSRQSSIGPITPNSAHFPTGLGVGLTEKDGITLASFPSPPTTGVGEMRGRAVSTCGVDGSPAIKRTFEAPKGKRKPVPEVAEPTGSDDEAIAVERHERVIHAL